MGVFFIDILLGKIKTVTKISILSVYNDQDFIKRSIDSILNNSFKDYELIIINDGSNDST